MKSSQAPNGLAFTITVHVTFSLGMCTAWNISILEYDENADDRAGPLLYTFCPREREVKYPLTWKTDLVVIRLLATTQTLPAFTMKWDSQVGRPNTRVSDPQPPTGTAPTICSSTVLLLVLILTGT